MFGTPTVIRPSAQVSVGVVGPRGATMLGGFGTPSDGNGYDGDFYVDTQNSRLYGPKTLGTWGASFVSIVGPQGAPGPQILSGGGAPTSSIGRDNDYYLDIAAAILYGPKTTGAWPTPGINLIGPQGNVGPATNLTVGAVSTLASGSSATITITGTAPNQTVNFGIPAGSVIYAGSGAPSAGTGANGDYYLDNAAYAFYGPKAAGAWPGSGFSLVGPQGNTVRNGSGAPGSGIGVNGDFYIDTANSRLYGPKASGAWPGTYVSLIGPAGPGSGSVNPSGTITAGHLAAFGSSSGTAIVDAGVTGKEALLPVQTLTQASYSYAAADLYAETRRANGGAAMSDTLPPASTAGLVNGTTLQINNVDPTAVLTLSPGSGTSFNAGATSVVISPMRSTKWVYDTAGPTWRTTMNSLSSATVAQSSFNFCAALAF